MNLIASLKMTRIITTILIINKMQTELVRNNEVWKFNNQTQYHLNEKLQSKPQEISLF